MAIITKSKLTSIANSKAGYTKKSVILGEARSYNSRIYSKTSIFLSHSHKDSEQVKDAVIFLRKLGVDVYIDWMDEEMPKKTSGETARKIKEKIKSNKKFILLATENAIASKWCNWELGYGDAQKYIEHIAILPVRNDYSDFSGSEYLQIYPYITESDYHADYFKVVYPDGKADISLSEWLKK